MQSIQSTPRQATPLISIMWTPAVFGLMRLIGYHLEPASVKKNFSHYKFNNLTRQKKELLIAQKFLSIFYLTVGYQSAY